MVDATDSKSVLIRGVLVQVQSPVFSVYIKQLLKLLLTPHQGVIMKYFVLFLASFACAFSHTNTWKPKFDKAMAENKHKLSPNSLLHKAHCVYSQYGEDGIIEEIFSRLNIKKGFFVEFGGCDGIEISNTRHLYEQGWEGAYIEADESWIPTLKENYSDSKRVQALHYFVTNEISDERGLLFDEIREIHFPDKEIDFLSIDIDGEDMYVLQSLECKPKVICIENNPYWHPLLNKEVPKEITFPSRQQPIRVLCDAAKKMGYTPVCYTINLFLIRNDLMDAFPDVTTDPVQLWKDSFNTMSYRREFFQRRQEDRVFVSHEGKALNKKFPINSSTLNF